MRATVIYFCTHKLFITLSASKLLESCKHFPENIAPRHLFLPKEHDKLINIPIFITLMLSNDSSVRIYKKVCFWTWRPFSLVACIKRATVSATMKHVVFFFKKELQLFHV